MRLFFIFLLISGLSADPSDALARLKEGNQRYVNDALLHPDQTSYRREELQAGQNPFATIVGCSDSRVAPEIVFDQGLGDLFIVRVAGNVVGPVELDSIDYSVKYLGSSFVLVMGHEACGAVTAVMKGQTADVEDVANLIKPAIKNIKNLEEATKANVRWVVANLKKSRLLKDYMAKGQIDVVGAYYHLGSGEVEILK